MQRNHAANCAAFSNPLENDMTAALSNPDKPKFLESSDCSAPDTRGSLGIRYVEGRDHRSLWWRWRELFKIELRRFPQVRDRFLKSLTLADDADLGTLGNIPRFFLVHHGSVGLNRHN